jgi:hypothetical protein
MKTDGCVEKQERFFHTSLQNPAGFRTVFTGSAEVNPQTTKPDRSFATKTGHFHLLPTGLCEGLSRGAIELAAANFRVYIWLPKY